ncbi:MAG: hypothetical protein ACK5IP_16835 [Paracoccus sp. (in: a-proteobacteria)]
MADSKTGNDGGPATPPAVQVSSVAGQNVEWLNGQVLAPAKSAPPDFSAPYADQVAAMLLEDMRAYLQGTEQVLVVATARSLDLILQDNPAGEQGLKAVGTMMKELPSYAGAIAGVYADILKDS